jgi:hypothetical protein
VGRRNGVRSGSAVGRAYTRWGVLLLPPAVPMPQLYRRTGGGAGRSNGREEGGSWEVVEGRRVVTAEGGREQPEAVWFGLAHEALRPHARAAKTWSMDRSPVGRRQSQT